MVPVKKLENMLTSFRSTRSPSDVGIEPLRLFCEKESVNIFVLRPISVGSCPVRLLLFAVNTSAKQELS
jgi:hypothetical protein